jgi:phage gp16-like protein
MIAKERSKNNRERQRRALLAKVHIAKKELGLDDGVYHYILQNEYGVESSAKLNIRELISLVERFESRGFKPRAQGPGRKAQGEHQAEALKERIGQELLHSPLNDKRLRGLVKKICGVDELRWARDPEKLKRLLAIIKQIEE